ncbi:hypothetical protein L4X63_06970 [Geomonas sp. Red32]|uniref:hypothetical protein n=1 Tax=Geomonas sp. Red32 TaxID=2912856 RepID=UPI00202CC52B|nr:hypothetical protein [Geomonas sp. Red32]MCM0081327.1 hypothetical protein [Geomonas sp. Red32]
MCLLFIAQIAPDAPARVSARRLSEVSGLRIQKIKVSGGGSALHFSTTGDCSCGLLADHYEIDAPIWKLEERYLPALVKALEVLGRVSKKFKMVAKFLGGEVEETQASIQLEELLDAVLHNRVQNNVVYTVTYESQKGAGGKS